MAIKTLADVCEIVMGQSPAGEMCNASGIGAPLLNGPTEYGVHHPKPVQFTTDVRKRAKEGDLLFCVRGSTTGRMNWADRDYAIGRGIAAIRHKSHRELQPMVRAVIEHNLPNLLIQATGSTFPNVSSGQLSNLQWPDLDEYQERAIAHILGTLDDKIELNRKQNETLESMARTLFKAWFVDFEPVRAKLEGRWRRGDSLPGLPAHLYDLFPERLVDSELGEIPEGWVLATVRDSFSLTMGQSPPGDTYNDVGNGLPFFQGCTDFGFRYPENRKYCSAPSRVADAEDTLVSVRAPVGEINLAWEKCCVGRGIAAVRYFSGARSFTYHALWSLQNKLKQFEHTGTVFGAINKKQFEALDFIEPTRDLINTYERSIGRLDDEIRSNLEDSRTLAKLRDTLLPKLISGELRVSEVERDLGDAR